MLKYLPYAIQALAIVGGVAGGLFLKSMGAEPGDPQTHGETEAASDLHDAAPEKHAEKAEKKKGGKADKKGAKKKEKKSGDHGGGHGGDTDEAAYGYMKFSRQFVVPVIGEAGVSSLIVLDINLEVPPSETETIYLQEPKLRDSLLATLLALSNNGAFSNRLLDQANLDAVRAKLLESARAIIGDSAQNVLILNVTRQDV